MLIAAQDIINSAFGKIRVFGPSEVPSAEDMQTGLDNLNDMLDSFSIEGLTVNALTDETFNLIVGQYLYTMGSGGNFDTTWPNVVSDATFLRDTSQTPAIDYPLNQLSKEDYAAIEMKVPPNSIPTDMFFDPKYPLANIYLWPPPDKAYELHTASEKSFAAFSDLTTPINLQPGYKEVLVYNLAVRLSADYRKQLTQEVMGYAVTLLSKLKSKNSRTISGVEALSDLPAGFKHRRGTGNIYNRWGM